MPTRYLNIVRFPISLEFKNQALGSRRSVTIGTLAGSIYLPTENLSKIDEAFSGLRPPKVRGIQWASKVFNHTYNPHEQLYWGKYFSWHPKDPAASAVASVRHAVLSFAAGQPSGTLSLSDIAAECHAHIPEWHMRLKDWIEVLTKQDLDAAHPLSSVDPIDLMTVPWAFHEGAKRKYEYVNRPLVCRGSSGDHALDHKSWSSALRAANNRLHPTEVRLLLRDARAALLRRSYRRTVLDAATAAELLVGPALREQLIRTNSTKVVEHLLKQGWHFKWRSEMMIKLGMWLPPNLDQWLMQVRNAVIHGNASITSEQARKALDVAEQLANRYQPLKLP